ncbi:MAG: hypothetical protein LC795_16205 [Acidobacteria bacterium]|nr:hypothetical protein [Acidobacteriota bacterium]
MRKTLFSVLPLLVFLGPNYAGLPGFAGLSNFFGFLLAPSSQTRVEPNRLRGASVNTAAERLRGRISEAKRELRQLPADSLDEVTLAVSDPSGGVKTVRASKEDFLKKDGEFAAVASDGEAVKVKVVRSNYVNTAVRVKDAAGRELQPLVVRYPVEKGGKLKEVAYYTSAHPAVENDEVARAGGAYVRERLDEAARKLAAKGVRVDPALIDVAERLAHVEHTDHKRFLSEDSASLFEEIRTLYALNGGDTYRYSVSSAGAGGMVQMIPPTYEAIREQHPRVGLKADFVEGMRDHANATQAMLVYLQDTWDFLRKQEEVAAAMGAGLATQEELLAAGYNSNPFKLPKRLTCARPPRSIFGWEVPLQIHFDAGRIFGNQRRGERDRAGVGRGHQRRGRELFRGGGGHRASARGGLRDGADAQARDRAARARRLRRGRRERGGRLAAARTDRRRPPHAPQHEDSLRRRGVKRRPARCQRRRASRPNVGSPFFFFAGRQKAPLLDLGRGLLVLVVERDL